MLSHVLKRSNVIKDFRYKRNTKYSEKEYPPPFPKNAKRRENVEKGGGQEKIGRKLSKSDELS